MNKRPNDEPAFETQFKGNKRYDTSRLTTEFLNSEDCVKRISETVNRIENELSSNRCINEAYGSFTNFLMNEMDLAGLTVTSPIKYECKSKQSKAKTFLKPYWSDLLQQKWDAASKKEKLWLKCSDHTNIKRKLKQEYCAARNDFDKHLRKAKRTYQNKLQMDLMTELEKPNSRDFWKQIGKIGISNDRRDQIPWEVIDDNGEVTTDKERVLQKWKTDYQTLFNDQTDSMLYDECHLDRIKKGEISSDPEHVDTSCLNEPITRCEVEKAGGHLEVVTFLVTHGSQLEATSQDGRTALHYAAEFGRIDVTKWLTDQGCSPWVKTKQGFGSKTFDVTLMICLIRNLTSINPPVKDLTAFHFKEITPGSDLARIKCYRNKLAHHDSNTIDTTYFNTAWRDISDVSISIFILGFIYNMLDYDHIVNT
ncbi:unnamed protein product [Mytilus edulis]|uniref:DZIP3-like HEPN domain-containing protein n=1 Tax=Mytilus edulis TaxID=6550 RepID=A0A8S3URF0_MYTED|nr:unnamed protein product [Mytilus edulis]